MSLPHTLSTLRTGRIQRPDIDVFSIDKHLASLMANPQWVDVLNKWHIAGGLAYEINTPIGELTMTSWNALQDHLLGSGWFKRNSGKIAPNGAGREFLTRVNELVRAIARSHREDRIVSQILLELPRGAAVDIGCGPGHSALRLLSMGYKPVYAYDLSPIAVKVAQALLEQQKKELHLFQKDASNLSEVDTDSLQLIFSRGALHYFNQVKLAKAIRRTLRSGGCVVAELIGLEYYLQWKHFGLVSHSRNPWRALSYARTVLRTLLYESFGVQTRLGGSSPEIGYTSRSIKRFAIWAGLEIVSIAPAPASVGFLVVMRKPGENVN
jgi:SAM-dependent methyltransferase